MRGVGIRPAFHATNGEAVSRLSQGILEADSKVLHTSSQKNIFGLKFKSFPEAADVDLLRLENGELQSSTVDERPELNYSSPTRAI
jgi:hypothetical protein